MHNRGVAVLDLSVSDGTGRELGELVPLLAGVSDVVKHHRDVIVAVLTLVLVDQPQHVTQLVDQYAFLSGTVSCVSVGMSAWQPD